MEEVLLNLTTEGALIGLAKLKRLPDKLGLNDIATLLFYHRREAAPNEIQRFEENLAAINFIHWINNQIETGSMPIEGRTSRRLVVFFIDVFEPILSKDEVKTRLEILSLFPLEEGCLLANWWADDQPQTERKSNPTHEKTNVKCPSTRKPQQRLNKILDVISQTKNPLDPSKKIDPLCIPEGVKKIVEAECLKDKVLFPKKWAFESAWTFGNECEKLRVKDKEKYL